MQTAGEKADGIVQSADAETVERREQVFHGLDRDTLRAERRGMVEPRQVREARRDRYTDVTTEELNTVLGRRRPTDI